MAIGVAWADGAWNDAAWTVGAWAQVASTAPTLVSATVAVDGDSIALVFSEAVTIGAGGNAGVAITASGGASTATYSSGAGTDTLVYALSRTIEYDETATIAYTQPGNGIEAVDDGADVNSFSGESTANNSAIGAPAGNARDSRIAIAIKIGF